MPAEVSANSFSDLQARDDHDDRNEISNKTLSLDNSDGSSMNRKRRPTPVSSRANSLVRRSVEENFDAFLLQPLDIEGEEYSDAPSDVPDAPTDAKAKTED